MNIRQDSRYLNVPLYSLTSGELQFGLRKRVRMLDDEKYVIHVVQDGERLDMIADTYYGNPQLWWIIADVNSIFRFWTMAIGTELKIPEADSVGRMLEEL
jgi:hypothetical protein